MKTKHTSYGIIPIFKQGEEIHICCVKNHKSGEWGLPKGTPEGTEKPIETAMRELKEETGIEKIKIGDHKLFSENYSFEQDGVMHDKTNVYFLGFVDEMVINTEDLDEIDEMKWINIDEASQTFYFKNIVDLLGEVSNYLNKFPLTNTYTGRSGETYFFEFFEADSAEHLPIEAMSQVAVFAFHNKKLLIVNDSKRPNVYGPVCGSIEKGEMPDQTLHRELKEEANMKVVNFRLLGYQKCTNLFRPEKPADYQLRYVAEVEPFGPFTPDCDPDGDVTELLEIDPANYRQYFDWGEIGEVLMGKSLGWVSFKKW